MGEKITVIRSKTFALKKDFDLATVIVQSNIPIKQTRRMKPAVVFPCQETKRRPTNLLEKE